MIELKAREIPFQAEAKITIRYKGRNLAQFYRADFICFNKLIVELKAQKLTTPADEAQVLNYLKASRLQRALLLNFGAPSLKIKRFVN